MKHVEITIRGGIAYITRLPKGVQVKITDHDSRETFTHVRDNISTGEVIQFSTRYNYLS